MMRSPWLFPAVFVLLLASAGSIVISARNLAQRSEPAALRPVRVP